LVTVGIVKTLDIPPPRSVAVLLEKVQLVRFGELHSSLDIPPPLIVAVFPTKIQLGPVNTNSHFVI